MGNIDSRACFNGGYLYVKTDRPYYYPGNEVMGKIHIRISQPCQAKELKMRITGKEKCSFLRRETITRERNGERHSETITHHEKYKKTLIDVSAHCFAFGSVLMPGDYIVPFQFTLPHTLPASIMYNNKHHHDRPKAIIQYNVKAVLTTHHQGDLKYKQLLVIHEPPVPFRADEQHTQKVGITTCCCMNQGTTDMSVQFDKNVFYGNETAAAKVSVSNKDCALPITEVEF